MSPPEGAELAAAESAATPPPPSFLDLPDGLHLAVSEETYHAKILGVASKGALEKLRYAPAVYHAWVTGSIPEQDFAALVFGRAAHCGLLEPDRFASTYTVEPAFGDCRKRENKLRRDEWRAENAGRAPLPAEDYAAILGIRSALLEHPEVGPLLRHTWATAHGVTLATELTLKWTCPETGLVCRARDDLYSAPVVLDVKTCADARPDGFGRTRAQYGYHRQAAHYVEGHTVLGAPAERFLFIAAEKTPPYLTAVYECTPALLDHGARQIAAAKRLLRRCVELDTWPGLPTDVRLLDVLAWERDY